MNTHVDFNTAKLLKEKGLNDHFYHLPGEDSNRWVKCEYCYDPNDESSSLQTWSDNISSSTKERLERLISAPIIAEVVMWLYEKHGIWIRVDCNSKESWSPILVNVEDGSYKVHPSYVSQKFIETNNRMYNSPTEAYLEAIKYCLTKLI